MNYLDDAFETLREHRLVWSQYQFSTQWLGRSKSYYAYLKSSGSAPSAQALLTLVVRLDEHFNLQAHNAVSEQSGEMARLGELRNVLWKGITKSTTDNQSIGTIKG